MIGGMMKVHAEIQYQSEEGDLVHSTICPPYCSNDMSDTEYRQFLHECLDECGATSELINIPSHIYWDKERAEEVAKGYNKKVVPVRVTVTVGV